MDIFTIIFTTVNACLTGISIFCVIRSTKETSKQTELMRQQTDIAQKQLAESYKPEYPTNLRLESIAQSTQNLDGTIKDSLHNK